MSAHRTESKAVTTVTTDLGGSADSLVDTDDDNSNHEVAISWVPAAILRASHAFVIHSLSLPHAGGATVTMFQIRKWR